MSERAEQLAQRFAQENAAFADVVAAIAAEQWGQVVGEGELRSVGMVAHHIVNGYVIHQRYFGAIASGEPLPPLTAADGDRLNADFAQAAAAMTKSAVVEALRDAGATATTWIRGLSDEQLDQRGVYLVEVPAWTVQKWVERGLIGHHPPHLADIRAALQR